jgi:DNA-binding beta-propeller fold protein YncE
MTLTNDGYAYKLTVAVLAAVLFALSGCTGASPEAKKEQVGDIVWPLPPEQPRIRFIRSIRTPADIGAIAPKSLITALFGGAEDKNIPMQKPYAVSADSKGRIFVGESALGRIFVFDVENKKFDVWGQSGPGRLRQPLGVAVDGEDRLYVSDARQQRVVVFDQEGKFLQAMGGKEQLARPVGIAIDDARDRIYVVDPGNHNIAVFNKAGDRVATLGKRGVEPGQFNFPSNIALDRSGRLHVIDSMNFRVQIIQPDGSPVQAFGQNSDRPGSTTRSKGIGVDPDGNIYVVDAAFNNFQIFNEDGALLLIVGNTGTGPGEFYLPAGAYLDPKGRFYVVDQLNKRIQVFQYLGESPAPSDSAEESAEMPSEDAPK